MSSDGSVEINLLGASDALELVLELARRRFRYLRRKPTRREASRLFDQAALEQLDYLLMEHWEVLDTIARRRTASDGVDGKLVWRVRSGLLVEQRPAEAVDRCLELAEEQLRDAGPGRDVSTAEAVSLGRRFLSRHGNELDARFGRTSA